jgi:hypothetical protein
MLDVERTTARGFVQLCLIVLVIRRWCFVAVAAVDFSCLGGSPVYGFHAEVGRKRGGGRKAARRRSYGWVGVGREDMPKSVATFLGLVLIAVSIGLNTWRFPIVLRMTDPSTAPAATEPVTPAAPTPTAELPKPVAKEPEPVVPPPAVLATKSEAKAESVVAEKPAAVPAPAPEAKAPISATPPAAASLATEANNSEALVPVPKVAVAGKSVQATEEVVVRRLPPGDHNEQSPAEYTSMSSGGVVRIYPSTGMQ